MSISVGLGLSSRHIAKPALSSVSGPILQYFLRLFIHDGCGVEAGLRWLCPFRLRSEEPCNNELLDTNRKLYIKRILLCSLAAQVPQATPSKAGQRHTGVFNFKHAFACALNVKSLCCVKQILPGLPSNNYITSCVANAGEHAP